MVGRLLACTLLVSALAGCTAVPVWKRGPLTHPTMTAEEIQLGLDGHVRAVSEGAVGGLAGAGGGCGCN
jgi:hypothetical protein